MLSIAIAACTPSDGSDDDDGDGVQSAIPPALISALPPEGGRLAQQDPDRFLALVERVRTEPEELTWLVDKNHPLAAEYVPEDIRLLRDYPAPLVLNRTDLSLREIILPDLVAMVESAAEEGITLDISSSYRSYDYQAGLFQRNVDQLGLEQAERESARPGTSQHQLGTTVDFGSVTAAFADTPAGRWLSDHAWRYGFSLSYPDGYEEITGYMYESWHYRYIGKAAAQLEREYFGGVQQTMLEYLAANRALD